MRKNPKNAVTLFAMQMLIECPFKECISIFAFLNHFCKVRNVSEQFGEKALSSLVQKSLFTKLFRHIPNFAKMVQESKK